jgi:hypothetical protein
VGFILSPLYKIQKDRLCVIYFSGSTKDIPDIFHLDDGKKELARFTYLGRSQLCSLVLLGI